MNKKLKERVEQVDPTIYDQLDANVLDPFLHKYAEALIDEIYSKVREELIDDADIMAQPDPEDRRYLQGCNGGTVDALFHIMNVLHEDEDI